eukprot:SAG22_NODE_1463_length_4360_cov_2.000939_1_plen_125_part_00
MLKSAIIGDEKAMAAVTAAVASERDEEDFIGDIVDAAPLFINSKLVKACVDCIRKSDYDKLRAVVAPFEADSQLLRRRRCSGCRIGRCASATRPTSTAIGSTCSARRPCSRRPARTRRRRSGTS